MKRGELQRLLKVPCTVKQARQIKRRNKQLLAALEAGIKRQEGTYPSFNVGCPHCSTNMNCTNCAWRSYPGRHVLRCTDAKFYGTSLNNQVKMQYIIQFSSNKETLAYSLLDTDKAVNNAILFLKGHIEWANAVVKRGGIGKDSKPINKNWNKAV